MEKPSMISDPYWRIPCEMADGVMQEILVLKGSNTPEMERRLELLEKECAKILSEMKEGEPNADHA
jgi:hypothetical protein